MDRAVSVLRVLVNTGCLLKTEGIGTNSGLISVQLDYPHLSNQIPAWLLIRLAIPPTEEVPIPDPGEGQLLATVETHRRD
jgi:hypothetical protein